MQNIASDEASKAIRQYSLPFGIEIRVKPEGGAAIQSELAKEFGKGARARASTDALESLLLAMASEGIDLSTAAMKAAVGTAVESISNNLD